MSNQLTRLDCKNLTHRCTVCFKALKFQLRIHSIKIKRIYVWKEITIKATLFNIQRSLMPYGINITGGGLYRPNDERM